ncbi:MAG: Lipoprotein-releasing system transrane protein LolE, partial [Planctomycetota bacterium]
MYAPLLANRYLTSRIIPFLAVAAVALCVALVIVVVSVMSGFLDMVRSSGKTLIGDVVVTRDIVGIPYYQDFIREI